MGHARVRERGPQVAVPPVSRPVPVPDELEHAPVRDHCRRAGSDQPVVLQIEVHITVRPSRQVEPHFPILQQSATDQVIVRKPDNYLIARQ